MLRRTSTSSFIDIGRLLKAPGLCSQGPRSCRRSQKIGEMRARPLQFRERPGFGDLATVEDQYAVEFAAIGGVVQHPDERAPLEMREDAVEDPVLGLDV